MSRLVQKYEALNHIFESRTQDPAVTIGPGPNQTLTVNAGAVNSNTSNTGNQTISGTTTFSANPAEIYVDGNSSYSLLQSKITGTGSEGFGDAVCISQNGLVMAVGSPDYNGTQGSVTIYTRSNITSTFTSVQTLTVSSTVNFGQYVAISSTGSTIAVGSPGDNTSVGSVYVYQLSAGTWSLQQTLLPTGYVGNPEFGWGIDFSLDSNTLLIGGPDDGANSNGAVWIYTRSGTTWTLSGSKISDPNQSGDNNNFGFSVSLALSATIPTFVVGAYGDNNYTGVVYVYCLFGNTWTNTQTIYPTVSGSWFGEEVSLSYDASTLIISAPYDSSQKGAFYALGKSPLQTTFSETTKYTSSSSHAEFGTSICLDRTNMKTLIVGAPNASSGIGTSVIYTNTNTGLAGTTTWTVGSTLPPTGYSGTPDYGQSVAIDEYQTVVIGGPQDNSSNGAVWVYDGVGTLVVNGNLTVTGSLSGGSTTFTNLTVTNLTATNATITNETVSTSNITTANITNANTTNLTASAATITNEITMTGSNPVIQSYLSGSATYLQKLTAGSSLEFGVVALSQTGLVLAVGAPTYPSGTDLGAIYVYTRGSIGSNFRLANTLTVTPISSPGTFGQSVAISYDGTTIIGGAPEDQGNIGATYVFFNNSYTGQYVYPTGNWNQQAYLVGTGYTGSCQQGWSCDLSLDGNTLITGGPYDNSSKGAIWVFTRSGTTWTQQQMLTATGLIGSNNYFGFACGLGSSMSYQGSSMSYQGSSIIVGGAYGDNSNRGSAFVFSYSASTWTQTQKITDGGLNTGNGWFGVSVCLSYDSNQLLVGASHNNSSAGAFYAFGKTSSQTTFSGPSIFTGASGTFGASVYMDRTNYYYSIIGAPSYSGNAGQVAIWQNSYGNSSPLLAYSNWSNKSILTNYSEIGSGAAGSFVTMDEYTNAVYGGILDNSSSGAAWVYSSYNTITISSSVVDITGELIVSSTQQSSSTTTGSINTAGGLGVVGNTNIGGTLGATGNTTLGGTLGVTGNTTLSGTLGVTGAATLSSTLGVTGATTLSSTLGVTGNTTVGGTLGVTGNTTLSGTLGVTGAATLSSTLGVSGIISGGNGKALFYQNSGVTLANGISETMTFPNSVFNTFGSNLTYNLGAFINNSGTDMYLYVSYCVRVFSVPANTKQINGYISVGGLSNNYYGQLLVPNGTSSTDISVTGSSLIYLSSGNNFQIGLYQNSGGNLTAAGSGTYQIAYCSVYQVP